jgi:hypothetical protein
MDPKSMKIKTENSFTEVSDYFMRKSPELPGGIFLK